MTMPPIAIVGRACVVPGALSPQQLWDAVRERRYHVSAADPGAWRTGADDVVRGPGQDPTNGTWHDRGGYVRGFDRVWDPEGFGVPAASLAGLDPLFTWVLHCARQALRDAGDDRTGAIARPRVRAVLGNLGFPTAGMNRYAESVWSPQPGETAPDPRNRFMSRGPAALLEQALGLAPGAFCLDGACASSLYAIAMGCAQLNDGDADLVLAGAVNRADDLFLHVGFCALKALSPSGHSRPFDADADGLIPGEGAGVVALKRLADARRDGDTIHGIIRGVGLSNDGRGRGFLAPSEEGQRRALEAAYRNAGVDPSEVSLLECHATGTVLGDATELRSTGTVFEDCEGVPIGSLKSNLGHLITAAGVAGLIKVLEAMRHRQRPATVQVRTPNPALDTGPFRLLTEQEDWPASSPRLAGVSAFGFGGNNAHLVVSEDDPTLDAPTEVRPPAAAPLAIVGVGAVVGSVSNAEDFAAAIVSRRSLLQPGDEGKPAGARIDELALGLEGLCFPPRDLQRTLAQQLAVLQAAREATADAPELPRDRTGVYVAMEADPEVCRYGLRWRLRERLRQAGATSPESASGLSSLEETIAPPLGAEEVVGTMPNIPANRLNRQLDLGGPSFTVSAGEASGRVALELAARALRTGQLDAAVVGAADLSCQAVHLAALSARGDASPPPGDAATVVVLRRLTDAVREGEAVLAVLETEADAPSPAQESIDALGLRSTMGHCWAAGDLRDVTAAALLARDQPGTTTQIPARPGGHAVRVRSAGPQLFRFAGADRSALERRLQTGEPGGEGPCRAAIIASTPAQLEQRRAQAGAHLSKGTAVGPGVFVRSRPMDGSLALVFSGAGAAYPGMGTPLQRALPELDQALRSRSPVLARHFDAPWDDDGHAPPLQRLWSSSYLTQLHAELTRSWLELEADAVIGYSSGESNSLFATGIWNDHDDMVEQCRRSGLFTEQIGGRFEAVARAWGQPAQWETWTVVAPVDEVIALVGSIPRVHVSIIHHDGECVVAGDPSGCAQLRERVGAKRCHRLRYDLAVHVPELQQVAAPWRELHRRPVTPPRSGLSVYSGATSQAYTPSEDACAEAILGQANRRLDYRRVIERAYADGVRVFVEHGPRRSCSGWIQQILGDRDAVVVALDRKGGGLLPVLETVAALWSASVPVRLDPRIEGLGPHARPAPPQRSSSPRMQFAARPRPLRMPPLSTMLSSTDRETPEAPTLQPMPPAPTLPPVGSVPPDLPTAAPPRPAPTQPAPAATVAPPPTVPPVATALPPTDTASRVAAVMQAQLATLGDRQRAFVQEQAALHQQFLAVRAQANAMLVGAMQGGAVQTPAATPTAPVPTPAPAITNPVAPIAATSQAPVAAKPAPAPLAARPAPKPAATTNRPSAKPVPAKSTGPRPPCGPTFDRAALEVHAGGNISEIYGPQFAGQDRFDRQVRMPLPPLLLADRVTGLDAEPMAMKLGTIWTETDVTENAWYLHAGRMPPGIMIESGQADLMLISYLGVDAENQGERVYRLLGCTLTFHGSPPEVGETLCFDIHLDGHAKQGKSRLMFFHYDCHIDDQVRLSVRQGQAGFFTDKELAESDGCLWSPQEQSIVDDPQLDAPAMETASSFTAAQVQAFAEGRPWDCFGDGALPTRCHTRTPRIQSGRMQLLHRVDEFAPRGGPWGRGYLRAETPITPDDWFFEGHFLNDPCMPGTLMFEGCLQALAFHLAAMGYTLDRDGWRFEPVPEHAMTLSCRGQVTPQAKSLTYEVFVEEISAGPEPTVYADLLCTVDGLKAFHARRVGLRLVPAWPLDEGHVLLDRSESDEGHTIARSGGFAYDYRSMLACAHGRPTEAFGPIYARFDGTQPVARLPNPPYHFISRATSITGEAGAMESGVEVQVEFDVDPNAWYFADNGNRSMPFAVLLEAALQPCGWLASFMGCALAVDIPLKFRNLDGHGTVHREVGPDDGVLRTRVRNTQLSITASMIIVGFDVECRVEDALVYEMSTVFGFFPASAFEDQAGLPAAPAHQALLEASGQEPRAIEAAREGQARLAAPMLMMLDRVAHFDPTGGAAGLGCARAEKDVDPGEWFFAAHFFQDPVQPGSLGIEAMLQLLQWCMRELGLDADLAQPRFEPLGLGQTLTWKYRGQVVPTNHRICTTLEITERGTDERGAHAIADAWLWVDGKPIYKATGIGMRIVSGDDDYGRTVPLSLEAMPELSDHRPTWTVPAVPMMSMVDLLASAARADEHVVGLRDVRVKGWLTVPEGFEGRLRIEREGETVTLVEERGTESPRPVATGRLLVGRPGDRPDPWPALSGEPRPLPYEDGSLFHGPAFARLQSLARGDRGASSVLRVDGSTDARGLAPILLDAATHGIPHDALHQWDARIPADSVAYPAWIPQLDVYGPTPTAGTVRCEARYRGPMGSSEFPSFAIQLIGDHGVWCQFVLVEACFPKGRLGTAAPVDRRAFLRDRVAVPGLSLSRHEGGTTRLTSTEVDGSNWLPGTVQAIYGTEDVAAIARKEHTAAAHELHPRHLPEALPLTRLSLQTQQKGDEITVTGDAQGTFDISLVRDFWTKWFGREGWPVEDLYYGLLERFVRRVVVTDPEAFAQYRGRSVLYLANHQVGIESLLFSIVASALGEVPTVTLAKAEHRETWLGRLIEHCFAYPEIRDPGLITFFDRNDPASLTKMLPQLVGRMRDEGRSMMVHVEGTRSRSCAEPVQALSGAFVDLALALDAPIVPVKFSGGLPRTALEERLEFPLGMGKQDMWFGAPISAPTLAAASYGERRQRVLDAINGLGPSHEVEQPLAGDPGFEAAVGAWARQQGVSPAYAALHRVLTERAEPCEQTRTLLKATDATALAADTSAEGRWLHQLAQWLLG
ncbi:MAG: beta-ketoacyl synthase N-terminal-like domain-containing protein [Myxococcota bacterium]